MSCLFDSLSYFHHNINSHQMRYIIVNYLSNNPKLGGLLTSDLVKLEKNITLNHYLRLMSNSNQWGGAIEIKAYCNIFKINVKVQSLPNNKIIDFISNYNTTKYISIKWNGVHYVPCRL